MRFKKINRKIIDVNKKKNFFAFFSFIHIIKYLLEQKNKIKEIMFFRSICKANQNLVIVLCVLFEKLNFDNKTNKLFF